MNPMGIIAFFALRKLAKLSLAPSDSTMPEDAFPLESLIRSADMAKLAYDDPKDLEDKGRNIVSEGRYNFFDAKADMDTDGSSQAHVWINQSAREAFVFFRGTDCRKDALINLDIRQKEKSEQFKNAMVHRGFSRQFYAIENKMNEFLKLYRNEYDTLTFTGHSLGGALATIATFHYIHDFADEEHPPLITCHTFGSPRVGDKNFSRLFEKQVPGARHWRVFDYEDPIPVIPASWRFHHVKGNAICLGRPGKLRIERTDVPWLLRPLSGIINIRLARLVSSHAMENYISKLKQLKNGKHIA